MFSKETLYDWNGTNVSLFKQINSIHGDIYDSVMILLSRMANHHNFPYYMGALVLWALLMYAVRKISKRGGAQYTLSAWLGVLLVLSAGYVIDGAMVKTLKAHFSYPRPYVALAPGDVRTLDFKIDPEDAHHSFPSGHESFATLMVSGLWPVLPVALCWLGILFMGGVAWSRMAEGMHFPADVLAGFLFTLIMVIILRAIIYKLLNKLFKIRC